MCATMKGSSEVKLLLFWSLHGSFVSHLPNSIRQGHSPLHYFHFIYEANRQTNHTSKPRRQHKRQTSPPASTTQMANEYTGWSAEALEIAIPEVEAQIDALQDEVAETAAAAQQKRQRKMEKLKAGIKEVKAKLRGLGVDVPGPGPKRKRQVEDGEDGEDGYVPATPTKKRKQAKKGGKRRRKQAW